ncbi:MAG: methyltransferase [Pseudomonadota bacterium]
MNDEALVTRNAFLDGRVSAWQSRTGFRAGSDSVILAAACGARPGDSVLELGCGAGVVSLCLAARVPDLHIVAVDSDAEAWGLAQRNFEGQSQMSAVQADIADLPKDVRKMSFAHVIANPPFFAQGSLAPNPARAAARHESRALADWIDVARRRLSSDGDLTLILKANRLADALANLNQGFGGIIVKPIAARQGHEAGRVVIRARKGARSELRLLAPIILHEGSEHTQDGEDDLTSEARAILRDGAALAWS